MEERVNKWKIFGYVMIITIIFGILARIMIEFGFMADKPDDPYLMYNATSVLWSWASLIFGIFTAFKLRKFLEIVYGIVVMFVVFIPPIGILIAMVYFAHVYYLLEERKLGIK